MNLQNPYLRMHWHKFQFFWPISFLKEKNLKRFFSMYSYVKIRPIPSVVSPYHRRSWSWQTWIYAIRGCFHICFSCFGHSVLGRKFVVHGLNDLNLHYMKMLTHKCKLSWLISSWEDFKRFTLYEFAIVAPPYPRGVMICIILNLHYLKMFQLSWSYGSCEEDFLKMSHRFLIIPNNGVVHNFHNITILLPGLLCARFSWKWPSVFGEDIENVTCLRTECDQKSPLELELKTFHKLCFMRGLPVTHMFFSILRAWDIGSNKFYIINMFF